MQIILARPNPTTRPIIVLRITETRQANEDRSDRACRDSFSLEHTGRRLAALVSDNFPIHAAASRFSGFRVSGDPASREFM
jgi:hypothetical protein